MKNSLLFFALCIVFSTYSQTTKKALFLGNSYTYYNSLPVLVENLANANGDIFTHDQSTPGGYQLIQHTTNATSLSKIQSDDWDYVVLQEQSQKPSFPPSQVATDVKPYATILNDSIKANNSCSKTMFFMTWGRENGDASNCANYTPLCTYEGMQARLRTSYLEMANENDAACSPVGAAWKKVREDFPTINLYTADESHPSIYGSYLAACVFYSSMFHKSTVGNTYWSTLDSLTAYRLQDIASSTVLDSLSTWHIETVATNFDETDSTITFCDSVEVLGDWYFTNTTFSDTINGVGSCAEITNYEIALGYEIIDSTISICDSVELDGNWYFSDTSFIDTITTSPCDLIVNYEINKIEAEIIDTIISSCDSNSISVDGIVYTQDTMFSDSIFGNPCLTVYNYTLNFNDSVKINYFAEAIYVKTLSDFGYNFTLNVQNDDSIFLYLDTILLATYPSIDNNLTPSYCFIDCDQSIDGWNFKTFTLVAKNECSIDTTTTFARCTDFWGAINSLDNNHWQISPNPAQNFINIQSESFKQFSVSLLDISGKELIHQQKATNHNTKLDVSIFEKGIYFVVIYDNNMMPIGQERIIIH